MLKKPELRENVTGWSQVQEPSSLSMAVSASSSAVVSRTMPA